MVTGVEVTAQDVQSAGRGLLDASLGLLYKGIEPQASDSLVTGLSTSGTASCNGGGTVSRTLDYSVPGRISNGDRMVISASNCTQNGIAIDGSLTFVFSNLAGTINSSMAWSATLALTYGNLSMAYNGTAIRVNGDLTMGYSQDGLGAASVSAGGNSLQMTLVKNNTVVVDRTLSAYDYSATLNGSSASFSTNYTLSGNFPKFGNATFTVATVTPFQVSAGSAPSSGILTVTATDKSSLRLTAVDAVNVRLEIDRNGDGTADQVINTTWADLRNRI